VKHFTPERLVQLQDRSSEKKFLAALDAWERATKRYEDQLKRIRSDLPFGLQQLIATVPLHDARVLDMWWGGRSQFTITLHPDSDPSRLVVLSYSLVEAPVEREVLPESVRSEPVGWLYDELDQHGTKRGGPIFAHMILLSDGREIQLLFRQVTVKRPVPVVPVAPAKSC
jgi:hypothetical protein